MKYKLIPSESSDSADSIYIYILPSSFEGSNFSIAYPDCRTEDILNDRILIKTFDGCSPMAFEEIETELRGKLSKKYEKYAERINTFFTTGVVVFILGIINWVIPDPLPLVDELLFTIGGGITAWKAWNDRKIKLPTLAEQNYRYGYERFKPEVELESILTVLFKSIRCKIDPLAAGENIQGLDRIEIDSLWITKYLDIGELKSDTIPGRNKLQEFINVLIRTLPVQTIVKMEDRKKSRKGLDKLKNKTIREAGITNDALAVYTEFYRSYLNYQADG